jgi:hypothetical protein
VINSGPGQIIIAAPAIVRRIIRITTEYLLMATPAQTHRSIIRMVSRAPEPKQYRDTYDNLNEGVGLLLLYSVAS